MNFRNLLKCLISKKARDNYREYNKEKRAKNMRLIMTYVLKNEENIIEQNIRFHKALGVDGFIVLSHNSTDNTNIILEKLKQEGLIYEIIYKTSPAHEHSVWVNDLVRIAKKKYKADWIINADADEFYYSPMLDLKKDIVNYERKNINVIHINSYDYFPSQDENFFNSYYFVKQPILMKYANHMNIMQDNRFQPFIGENHCKKVIHTTRGFKRIADGNHDVNMYFKNDIESSSIVMYHYHIKNYIEYEKKAQRWLEASAYLKGGMGAEIKLIVDKYNNGKLKEEYNSIYNKQMKEFLISEGVISIDKSIINVFNMFGIRY